MCIRDSIHHKNGRILRFSPDKGSNGPHGDSCGSDKKKQITGGKEGFHKFPDMRKGLQPFLPIFIKAIPGTANILRPEPVRNYPVPSAAFPGKRNHRRFHFWPSSFLPCRNSVVNSAAYSLESSYSLSSTFPTTISAVFRIPARSASSGSSSRTPRTFFSSSQVAL